MIKTQFSSQYLHEPFEIKQIPNSIQQDNSNIKSLNNVNNDLFEHTQLPVFEEDNESNDSSSVTNKNCINNSANKNPNNNNTFKNINIVISSTNDSLDPQSNSQFLFQSNQKHSSERSNKKSARSKTGNQNVTASTTLNIHNNSNSLENIEVIIKPCDDSEENSFIGNNGSFVDKNRNEFYDKNSNLFSRTPNYLTRNNSVIYNKNHNLTFYEKSLKYKEKHDNELESLKKKYQKKDEKEQVITPKKRILTKSNSTSHIPIYKRGIELYKKKQIEIAINEKNKIKNELNLCKIGNKKKPKHIIDKFIQKQFEWNAHMNMKKREQMIIHSELNININYNNKKTKTNVNKQINHSSKYINNKLYNDAEIRNKHIEELKIKYQPSFKPKTNISLISKIKGKKNKNDKNKKVVQYNKVFMFNFEQKEGDKQTQLHLSPSSSIIEQSSVGNIGVNEGVKNKYSNCFSKETSNINKINNIRPKYIGLKKKSLSTKGLHEKDYLYVTSSGNCSSLSLIHSHSNINLYCKTKNANVKKRSSKNLLSDINTRSTTLIHREKEKQQINDIGVGSTLIQHSRNLISNDDQMDNSLNQKGKERELQSVPLIHQQNNNNPSWLDELQMIGTNTVDKNVNMLEPVESLYMINTRQGTSTGINPHITVIGKEPFVNFFK